MRLLIVGGVGGTNVGESFFHAARARGLEARIVDSTAAYRGSRPLRFLAWYLAGHRPAALSAFSRDVEEAAKSHRATIVVTTGLAPVTAATLRDLGKRGIVRVNFLTDDPFNPNHAAPWFEEALPQYDFVFSPRKAGMPEIAKAGCPDVRYLPFGYDERHFFPDPQAPREMASDLFFAGNGDADRARYIAPLLDAGIDVRLYGDYWPRYLGVRGVSHGHAGPDVVRHGLNTTKVGLCLVRRANRDGNSMRTFEVPAAGACPLMEDTQDHREIFGPEGHAVLYFSTPQEAVAKTQALLRDDALQSKLAREAHKLIRAGGHTYGDRLDAMLRAAQPGAR